MTYYEDDDLSARLRAADPAAAHTLGPPDRAAVKRGLARRSARRAARLGASAVAVAGAVTLAVSLAPSSDSRLDRVVERAAAATAPAEGKIVAISTRKDGHGTGHEGPWSLRREETTWVRYSPTGEVLNVRSLVTDSSPGEDGRRATGLETVTERAGGKLTLREFDPVTKEVRTHEGGEQIPGLTFAAHRLLTAAQAGDARVRLDGEETIDGRRAHRLVVTAWDEKPLPKEIRERRELLIDAETYEPIAERVTTKGTTVNTASAGIPNGSPFTYNLTERVVRYDELPDSAENRKLLTLHGDG